MSKLSPRRWVVVGILLAGVWAASELNLDLSQLSIGSGGLGLAAEFFSYALHPAVDYQDAVPAGTSALWLKCLQAAGSTVVFAAAAISLALVAALPLAFLASTAWWSNDLIGRRGSLATTLLFLTGPIVCSVTRVVIAMMRSIHELLWAVLLLAAFGINPISACIAIALPSAGTLAKIFAEMIDETPRQAGLALRGAGASSLQIYFFALLPQTLADILAYLFYRFECALRSAAVLGFFGFPTLGFYIAAAFENLHYAEVWTYLYTLFVLIALIDMWSGKLRKSLSLGVRERV